MNDQETQLQIIEQDRGKRLKENEDWKWAKQKLEDCINAVTSIGTLPKGVTATTLQKEIDSRHKAIGLIRTWIEEVEGAGIQQEFNKINKEKNELITRFGEE